MLEPVAMVAVIGLFTRVQIEDPRRASAAQRHLAPAVDQRIAEFVWAALVIDSDLRGDVDGDGIRAAVEGDDPAF